jgi:formylglycine-generating enzyme required for sulfatase activity
MKTMKKLITFLAVVGLVLALAPAAQGVTIDRVLVGNTGNTGEALTAGGNLTVGHPVFGAVSYEYWVGTYEVSNAQYAEFLNAVAKNDSNLYNTNMNSNARGGITRSGSAGSYTYSVKSNMGDKPVNYVFASDAARFANWLHNGQPTTGVQTNTTTEDGAYDMQSVGLSYNDNFKLSITRDAGWQWALPNLDESHKAAYHKNDGDTGNYWDYATASDTAPSTNTANGTGVGSAGDSGNFANFNNGADWNAQDGNVTTVGSNGGPSPYGTYDQNGNIGEWNEEMWDGNKGSFAGGTYASAAVWLSMTTADLGNTKTEGPSVGFRVVTLVPPAASTPSGKVFYFR